MHKKKSKDIFMKKKEGWHSCQNCELWKPISCLCSKINASGISPCEVMTKETWDLLDEWEDIQFMNSLELREED